MGEYVPGASVMVSPGSAAAMADVSPSMSDTTVSSAYAAEARAKTSINPINAESSFFMRIPPLFSVFIIDVFRGG